MFQLIGSLLALFAIMMTLAGDPLSGAIFALLTFLWVLKAQPGRRVAPPPMPAWDAFYGTPFGR